MTVVVPRRLGLSGSSSVEQWSWLESWTLGSINWLLSLSFLDRLLFQFFLEHSGTSGETALHIVRQERDLLERPTPARCQRALPSRLRHQKRAIVQLDKGRDLRCLMLAVWCISRIWLWMPQKLQSIDHPIEE
jgi:hypothetical protein